MLVSSPTSVQRHQRQHRRQNSIPVALEAAKAPLLPASAMQRLSMHKRGMSLNQPTINSPLSSESRLQDESLQETQRQGINQLDQQSYLKRYLEEQHFVPDTNSQRLETRGVNVYTNQYSYELSPTSTSMSPGGLNIQVMSSQAHRAEPASQPMQQPQFFQDTTTLGNGVDSQLLGDETLNQYLINQSMLAQMYDIRRASVQSDMSQPSYIPSTPPKQLQSSMFLTHLEALKKKIRLTMPLAYVPITPDTTPFRKGTEFVPLMRSAHTSPVKNMLYQPSPSVYMQRAKSLQGVPGSNYAEPKIDVPSPPNTAPVDYDCFDLLTSQESDFESSEFQVLSKSISIKSDNHRVFNPNTLSATTSFQSSPELAYMPLPEPSPEITKKVPISAASPSKARSSKSSSPIPDLSPSKARLSPKVASIDSLNLDSRVQASITETGITIDEIAAYISGPDPVDGKWVCIHPGCDRRFGRKENIKSHIQTHLGDRQYKCDHCDKCFVRGHDLKRHAKIHTGDKPYECQCGNVFARHDALTRHRQRGMCIGGYKGIVRKTTKRGRPKKSRPELEERHEKAVRTRERASARSTNTSVSGSDSSCSSPPSDGLESMSIHTSSPMEDTSMFETGNYCLPSEVFSFTPPVSPGHSMGYHSSPGQSSRSFSPSSDHGSSSRQSPRQPLEDIAEEIPDLPPISEAAGCFDPEPEKTLETDPTISMVPALTQSTAGGDIDIFINNNSSFSDFDPETGISGGMDLFSVKSTGVNDNDFFLDFNDDPTNDAFFQ